MRSLLLASAAIVFALVGVSKASAWETQTANDTNADGSSPYADYDDALQDSADRGGGMPAYHFDTPRFGTARPETADHGSNAWTAERKRLVFGPFDDNVYAEPSAQQ
jgi:hypothetical protein